MVCLSTQQQTGCFVQLHVLNMIIFEVTFDFQVQPIKICAHILFIQMVNLLL